MPILEFPIRDPQNLPRECFQTRILPLTDHFDSGELSEGVIERSVAYVLVGVSMLDGLSVSLA